MSPIQATGHSDLFEDHQGNWWAVFLGIRYAEHGFHNLGRETFLAPVTWTADDWPIVNAGEKVALTMKVERELVLQPWPVPPAVDDFDGDRLAFQWVFLRNPAAADWSLQKRAGWLWLRCSPVTLNELASPAFVGRRQQHFECRATALLDFTPGASDEEAGLVALIDNQHHAEILVTSREGRRVILLRRVVGNIITESAPEALPEGKVELFLEADRREYRFGFAGPGRSSHVIGAHPVRYLSTEVAGGYTGVMLGLYAGANGRASTNGAFFDWFKHEV